MPKEICNLDLFAYREGRFHDIPDELFDAVVAQEALNDAPKPDEELVEAHREAVAARRADGGEA